MRKQNKGEWSEYYAKIFLLVNNSIRLINIESNQSHPCTMDTIRIANKQYRVMGKSIYETKFNPINNERTSRFMCFKHDISNELEIIRNKILKGHGSFSIPEAEWLANKLGIDTACDYSHNKGDIILQCEENGEGRVLPSEGFSLKSYFGCNPTLLNASIHSTKIKLKIDNVKEQDLITLKSKKFKARENMTELMQLSAQFNEVFYSETMEHNLEFLQSKKELTLAVIKHFTKTERSSSKMTYIESMIDEKEEFKNSMKKLLRSALVGMNPSEKWDGVATLSDNLLLVTKDGTCQAFLGKKTLESYLYDFCYIDTPSQSRHKYGFLYKEDGQWYIDLNFQIRLNNLARE